MAESHKWQFKSHFRRGVYSWKSSNLAAKRLKQAVSEIVKVAKKEPVRATEGIVDLFIRVYPATEHVDDSFGKIRTQLEHAYEKLLPILISVDVTLETRRKWMKKLYEGVCEDGVNYLDKVEDYWGEICVYPELVNEWVDFLLPELRRTWADKTRYCIMTGASICLSCLLAAERYVELEHILSLRQTDFWPYSQFWAKALMKQGRLDEAIEYAETHLTDTCGYKTTVMEFCEQALIEHDRSEEAYRRFGQHIRIGNTYLTQYKRIVKKYPGLDPKRILLDLIEQSASKSDWFASARQMGFYDIALECAYAGGVDPMTLTRAARDTVETHPDFAYKIAYRAIERLLEGYGFNITYFDIEKAYLQYLAAAKELNETEQAIVNLKRLFSSRRTKDAKKFEQILMRLLNRNQSSHTLSVNGSHGAGNAGSGCS